MSTPAPASAPSSSAGPDAMGRDAMTSDPDGPIVGAPFELPILSRDPASLPLLERGRAPEWLVRLGVLALACAIFLPNVGSFGLWDPWETHYGEVTRYMIESGDWVHPWWGYRGEQIAGEAGPGEHFYSKPILLFWMEATAIKAIGLSETAIRLPVAIIAIFAMMAAYYAFSKLLGRPRGFLIAVVLATCPQFFFLARQSQTDMPFVGTLTVAMCFFCLALFGPREKTSDRRMWGVLIGTLSFILAVFLPQLGIITADINHDVPLGPNGTASFFATWKHTGWMQAATYLIVMALVILSIVTPIVKHLRENGGFTDGFKDQLRRRCYLWIFYTFCALSLMGKGLLGFMLPGAVIFVYLAVTGEWTLLVQPFRGSIRGRAELIRGIAIFLCVGLPWYVGLLSGPEGKGFWNRFFIHDHFNRLGSGVHAIDDGTFEHFLKWLGYGMWPWVGFMPLALMRFVRHPLRQRDPISRLKLFLFLWFFLAFTLFTLSSTKFHHYIFPALPPLAILIGWSLGDLVKSPIALRRAAVVIASGLVVLLAWDMKHNPQHLRNLFTYKYDREWPREDQRPIDADLRIKFDVDDRSDWEANKTWAESDFYKHTPESLHSILNTSVLHYDTWLPLMLGLVLLGLVLLFFAGPAPPLRMLAFGGVGTIMLAGVGMAAWVLSYYMPMLAPHWSQKYLFERYYDVCVRANNPGPIDEAFTPLIADSDALMDFFQPEPKRVCEEEVISWLLTWRGETYYSNNAIRPIQKENKQFTPYLEELNKGARFFVHIERTRAKSFKGRVESHVKKLQKDPNFAGIKGYDVTLEHNENYWFVLLRADPICRDGWTKDRIGRCIKGGDQVSAVQQPIRGG